MSQSTQTKRNSRKEGRNFRISNDRGYTLGSSTNYVRSGGPARHEARVKRHKAQQLALHIRHEGKMTLRNQQRSSMFWLDRAVQAQMAAEHIYPLK
jgi:hypothetical protein